MNYKRLQITLILIGRVSNVETCKIDLVIWMR